jgi:DNA-binding transcriptional regulator LsrR (DeoR family)
MVIHKQTRLTPLQREEIYKSYYEDKKKVTDLADEYHVSRPTIYRILDEGAIRTS